MSSSVDIPPPRPLERYVQLETDHFCDCGYNLHGQVVERDERLGFMICRCPECGRFHPAGHGVAARTVWLGRVVVGLLILYILGLLGASLFLAFMIGVCDVAFLESMRPSRYSSWRGPDLIILHGGAALLCVMTGAMFAVAMWHTKKSWQFLALLAPVLAGVFVGWLTALDNGRSGMSLEYRMPVEFLPFYVAGQCVITFLALRIGRPIARLVVRLVVPPRPRQFLAFLWHADGLTPPFPKASSDR